MVCNVYACFEKEQKGDTRFAVVYPNSEKKRRKKILKAKEKKRIQAVINAKIVKSKSDLKELKWIHPPIYLESVDTDNAGETKKFEKGIIVKDGGGLATRNCRSELKKWTK